MLQMYKFYHEIGLCGALRCIVLLGTYNQERYFWIKEMCFDLLSKVIPVTLVLFLIFLSMRTLRIATVIHGMSTNIKQWHHDM